MSEKTFVFPPAMVDSKFQSEITRVLHERIMDPDSEATETLAELGYIHAIDVYAEGNKRRIIIFFDAKLATMKDKKKGRILKNEFALFENYFYVGDVYDCVSVDNREVPAYTVEEDENTGNMRVVMSKKDNKTKNRQVLMLSCNVPLTLGCVTNSKMSLDTFDFTYSTMGTGSIETTVEKLPLQFTVNSKEQGFDPDDAIPYLLAFQEVRKEQEKTAKKLAKEKKKESKDVVDRQQQDRYKGYASWS